MLTVQFLFTYYLPLELHKCNLCILNNRITLETALIDYDTKKFAYSYFDTIYYNVINQLLISKIKTILFFTGILQGLIGVAGNIPGFVSPYIVGILTYQNVRN